MGRREQNKDRKRQALEQAALALFLEQGVARASVEQVVAAAGMARGTFYLYFDDKQALFEHLVRRLADPAMAALDDCRAALVRARTLEETRGAYARLRDALTGLLLEHAGVALLYLREQRSSGPWGGWLRRLQARIDGAVADMCATMMERGLMRRADPQAVARAIAGAIERLAFDALSGSFSAGTEVGAEVERLFAEGLLATAPAAR